MPKNVSPRSPSTALVERDKAQVMGDEGPTMMLAHGVGIDQAMGRLGTPVFTNYSDYLSCLGRRSPPS